MGSILHRFIYGPSPKRGSSRINDTDEVYPLHFLDDNDANRSSVLVCTLRFNDVLDADVLHDALARLMEIGDWRKLGGRLRLTKMGKLEIHVPKPFTADRPAVRFTREVFDMNIEDHPTGNRLPKPTDGPSVQPGAMDFLDLTAQSDSPRTIHDFLRGDKPQISLHVASFANATLVSLSWPHTMMDAMGQLALVKAWSAVLEGREAEVPPLLGAREDPLAKVGTPHDEDQEPFVFEHLQMRGCQMLRFGMRFLWDLFWKPVETRHIFFPAKFVAGLRYQALETVKEAAGGAQFLSEGDILNACLTRLFVSSQPRPRPVMFINVVDTRTRITSTFEKDGAYLQNLVLATITFFSVHEATTAPLGLLAAKHRRSIAEQANDAQMRAMLRLMRREAEGGQGMGIMCEEPGSVFTGVSNWTKANFIEAVDFGSAVVGKAVSAGNRTNRPGTMVSHHAGPIRQIPTMRNMFNILGKDHDGNYWLHGAMIPESWTNFEEELAKLASQPDH